MRTSKDQYKLPDGSFIEISQNEAPPKGAVIWNGYDYINQYWVFQGKRDTRTLEELKASIRLCIKCGERADKGDFCSECADKIPL